MIEMVLEHVTTEGPAGVRLEISEEYPRLTVEIFNDYGDNMLSLDLDEMRELTSFLQGDLKIAQRKEALSLHSSPWAVRFQ